MSASSRTSMRSPGKPGIATKRPPPVVWQTFGASFLLTILAGAAEGVAATSTRRATISAGRRNLFAVVTIALEGCSRVLGRLP